MRNICVYTSTRADYGLLRNVIHLIQDSSKLNLQLLVSGTHLVPEQGMTVTEIAKDGFEVTQCIDIEIKDDSPEGICHSMGVAVSQYGKFMITYNPDIVLVLGDRFETFCCALAAQVCCSPIAHIHGGEITQGAIDEAFRHSITKMAHIHFPCSETYRNRIIQMGEAPESVFNVGALGVENIRKIRFMGREQLETSLGFRLNRPFFLVTFHPTTLEKNSSETQLLELLSALEKYPDYKCIFTYANADANGKIINKILDEYCTRHATRCFLRKSLGYTKYLSAMKLCHAVVGNSSSGMIEAPALKVLTVNIGDRQKGRVRTESVVDCQPTKISILQALTYGFSEKKQLAIKSMKIPHEREGTSRNIVSVLETANLQNILKKKFYDIRLDSR